VSELNDRFAEVSDDRRQERYALREALENARILYEHSEKTAAEACEIAGVGRRTRFAYLTARRRASA